jgi:hypothetical protein
MPVLLQRRSLTKTSVLAWIYEYRPKIRLPGKGLIPFDPTYAQQVVLNCEDLYRILNKSRQAGFTTAFAIECLHHVIYTLSAEVVVLSKSEKEAKRFLDKFYDAYDSIKDKDPNCPKMLVRNKFDCAFEGGATVNVLTSSKNSGRSYSPTRLYMDEAAFNQYADDIYTASLPSLEMTNGAITIFSTPNGKGNLFENICTNAEEMEFTYFKFEWWFFPPANPYYKEFMAAYFAFDEKKMAHYINEARKSDWYKKKMRKYAHNPLKFLQEYECNFDASTDMVFGLRQLETVFTRNYLPEYESEFADTHYRDIYHKDRLYVMGTDLGRKQDATVIVVFDVTEMPARMVEYQRIAIPFIGWDIIAAAIKETWEYWQRPDAVHDASGSGDAITMLLQTKKFYVDSDPFTITGNQNNNGSKYQIIENLRQCIDNIQVIMPKVRQLYREFENYRWNDKNIVQDSVLAVALAVQLYFNMDNEWIGALEFDYMGSD